MKPWNIGNARAFEPVVLVVKKLAFEIQLSVSRDWDSLLLTVSM